MRFNHDNTTSHFYASSAEGWITTTPQRTLKELLAFMERDGLTFNLFYVPLPYNSSYVIKNYEPQVEGVELLGQFEPLGTRA